MSNAKIQNLPSTEQRSRQGVDVKEILEIIIRRKWVILAVAGPIILLAVVGTLRSTDVVTASARVLIEGEQSDQLMFRAGRMDYDEVMATAAQIGMSIPVAEKAAEALVDSMSGLAISDPNFAGAVTALDLRDALLGGVDCGPVGESRILRIAFTDANPRFSIMAVEALTEAFIEYSVESVRNHRAIGYFEEQIATVQAEIDDLMRQRADILNESGYSTFKISAQAESNYSGVVDLDYQRAMSRRLGLQARLEGFVAALRTDPEFVPMSDGNAYNLLTEQRRELDEARSRLADLMTRYQEDYALVKRQKELVAVAEQGLRNVQSSYVRDIEIQLDEARRVEGSFEAALKQQTEALVSFPEVEWRVESLNLQIETKRDLLKGLQLRRGEVRLRADTDRRISNIVPLDRPTIEMAVAGSKKALYLALASLFAVALGLMAALFIENQDHRLYSRRHVEQYLQLPVMGAISDQRQLKG